MARKRALKDAIKDPLVAKAIPVRSSKSSELPVPIQRSVVKVGKMALLAAVAAGFICGWLAGRFIRII
jgi:hypothetical protein